jgi:SnoaL-like domain
MAQRPVRFPPGSVPPAGLYRSTGSGRVRFFDGGTPLPGSTNSSSWQQVSDIYRVVETRPNPLARHTAAAEGHPHPVRFAAGTVVSPGEYRNAASGAVRYFDGATPLPGGVNGSSWQQVSDHYHAHEQPVQDRRPLITFPVPAIAVASATAVLEAPPIEALPIAAPSAPSAPSAPPNAGELAVELIRRLNDGELVVADLFAPDAHLFFPLGSLLVCHRGHLQLRRLLDWLRTNLEGHTLSIERISGMETNVTVDFDTRGRVTSGEDFDRPGAMMIEARDGRIRMVHIALGESRAA